MKVFTRYYEIIDLTGDVIVEEKMGADAKRYYIVKHEGAGLYEGSEADVRVFMEKLFKRMSMGTMYLDARDM